MKSINQVSKGYLRCVYIFFLVNSPKPFKLRVNRNGLDDLFILQEQICLCYRHQAIIGNQCCISHELHLRVIENTIAPIFPMTHNGHYDSLMQNPKRLYSSNVDEGVLIQSERGVLIKSECPVVITLKYSIRVYRLDCLHVELSLRPRSSA